MCDNIKRAKFSSQTFFKGKDFGDLKYNIWPFLDYYYNAI